MSCAKRRRAIAAQVALNLPGAEGFVLVEYQGEDVLTLESRTTDAIYAFAPGARRYVDAFDVGMLKEAGEFVEVDE